MRKTTALLVAATACIAVHPVGAAGQRSDLLTEQLASLCDSLGDAAGTIMRLRQDGISQGEVIEFGRKKLQGSPEILSFVETVVPDAYSTPRVSARDVPTVVALFRRTYTALCSSMIDLYPG